MQKIIVFRYDKIGDLIISTPLLRCIKNTYPNSRITLVASPYNAPVLENHNLVDEIIIFDKKWNFLRKIFFYIKIIRLKVDISIVLYPAVTAFFMSFISFAKIRAGVKMIYNYDNFFGIKLNKFKFTKQRPAKIFSPILLTHSVSIDRGRTHRHFTDSYLDLAKKIGLQVSKNLSLELPNHVHEDDQIRSLIKSIDISKPILGINLSPKWSLLKWSLRNFEDLLEAIDEKNAFIKFIIATHDEEYFSNHYRKDYWFVDLSTLSKLDKIKKNPPPWSLKNNRVFFNPMNFNIWSALIKKCDLAITPESGFVHVAAAHKVPSIVIYPEDPEKVDKQWAPWQSPTTPVYMEKNSVPINEIVNKVQMSRKV